MNPHPVNPEDASPTSRQPGTADCDQPYTWGRPPATYLAFRQIVRLTILRSKLQTVRCERLGFFGAAAPAELTRN